MDPKYLMQREVQEALLGLPDDTWFFELERAEKLRSACANLTNLITDKRTGLMLEPLSQALEALGKLLLKTKLSVNAAGEESEMHEDQKHQRDDQDQQKVLVFVAEVEQAVERLMND